MYDEQQRHTDDEDEAKDEANGNDDAPAEALGTGDGDEWSRTRRGTHGLREDHRQGHG